MEKIVQLDVARKDKRNKEINLILADAMKARGIYLPNDFFQKGEACNLGEALEIRIWMETNK